MQKEIKQNTIRKKIILKGNITTTYIEHKYESTRTSVLSPPQNVETQYQNLFLDSLLKYVVNFPGKFDLVEYITKFLPALF